MVRDFTRPLNYENLSVSLTSSIPFVSPTSSSKTDLTHQSLPVFSEVLRRALSPTVLCAFYMLWSIHVSSILLHKIKSIVLQNLKDIVKRKKYEGSKAHPGPIVRAIAVNFCSSTILSVYSQADFKGDITARDEALRRCAELSPTQVDQFIRRSLFPRRKFCPNFKWTRSSIPYDTYTEGKTKSCFLVRPAAWETQVPREFRISDGKRFKICWVIYVPSTSPI